MKYKVVISQYWGVKETLAAFSSLIEAVNYIKEIKPSYVEHNNDVVFTIESSN